MTEIKIIQSQIDNLMNTLRNIRTNLYELNERDKVMTGQVMILENIKDQIMQNNKSEDMEMENQKDIAI